MQNLMTETQTKEIEVWYKQYDFLACPDRFKAFIGGIGSGKTFAGVLESLRHAGPKTLGLVVAPTYTMLRDATLRTFYDVLGDIIPYEFNKGQMLMTLCNGAEIIFRSADEPDRLRGPNLHWAYLDEAALCHPDTWLLVIGRLRAEGEARPCWITTTPRGKKNWLYQRLHQITCFSARTQDNPYLADEFIADLERTYEGDFARQELEGAFVSFEGLIYDSFDRLVHVIDAQVDTMLPSFKRVIIGVDEGYTNPSAALVIGLDNDSRAYVIDEFYSRQVLQQDLVNAVDRLRKRYNAKSVFIDPSSAGLIAACRSRGIPAMAGVNEVFDGIQRVKARFPIKGDGLPRIFFHRNVVNTISELESYCWNERKLTKEEPLKMNDHAMDALRYGLYGATYGIGIYL